MPDRILRKQIVEACRRLSEGGYIVGGEGNVSALRQDGTILITPAGFRKGDVRETDLVVLDLDGRVIGIGEPSSEFRMHLRLYQRRADCRAVVHAHPTMASAFALVGETVPTEFLAEAAAQLGEVALAPYGSPGTDALPDSLEPYIQDHVAFLLQNHGATTIGTTVDLAMRRMEVLEQTAAIMHAARALGIPQAIPGSGKPQ